VGTGSRGKEKRSGGRQCVKGSGGRVGGSVCKKTDVILVGEDHGANYDKAKDLGIALLDEAAFQKKL